MKRLVFLGLLAIVALMVWKAAHLSGQTAMYPLFVTIGGLVSLTAYFARSFQSLGAGRGGGPVATPTKGVARIAIFIVIWLAYVALLPIIGFSIATWLALVSSHAVIGGRTSIGSVVIIAAFVIALVVLTTTALYIPIPTAAPDTYLQTLIYQLLQG